MAKRVRARPIRHAGALDPALEDHPRAARAERSACGIQKDRCARRSRASGQHRTATGKVGRQGGGGGRTEEQIALLVALANHAQPATFDVEPVEPQPGQLADAHAGGVEELEQRRVTPGQRVVACRDAARAGDQVGRLVDRQHAWQACPPPRRPHAGHRIRLDRAVPKRVPVERARGGHAPRDRAGRQAAIGQMREVGADGGSIGRSPVDAAAGYERQKLGGVAAVFDDGAFRCAPRPEAGQECVQRTGGVSRERGAHAERLGAEAFRFGLRPPRRAPALRVRPDGFAPSRARSSSTAASSVSDSPLASFGSDAFVVPSVTY